MIINKYLCKAFLFCVVLLNCSSPGLAQQDSQKLAEARMAFEKHKDCRAALEVLQTISTAGQADPDFLLYMARVNDCLNNVEAALKYYEQVDSIKPGDRVVLDRIGELRYLSKHPLITRSLPTSNASPSDVEWNKIWRCQSNDGHLPKFLRTQISREAFQYDLFFPRSEFGGAVDFARTDFPFAGYVIDGGLHTDPSKTGDCSGDYHAVRRGERITIQHDNRCKSEDHGDERKQFNSIFEKVNGALLWREDAIARQCQNISVNELEQDEQNWRNEIKLRMQPIANLIREKALYVSDVQAKGCEVEFTVNGTKAFRKLGGSYARDRRVQTQSSSLLIDFGSKYLSLQTDLVEKFKKVYGANDIYFQRREDARMLYNLAASADPYCSPWDY